MLTNNEVDKDSEVHFSIDNFKMINNVKTVNNSEIWYKDLNIDNIDVALIMQ